MEESAPWKNFCPKFEPCWLGGTTRMEGPSKAQVGQFQILQVLFVFISAIRTTHPSTDPHPCSFLSTSSATPTLHNQLVSSLEHYFWRDFLLANLRRDFPARARVFPHRLLRQMIDNVTDLNTGASDVDVGGTSVTRRKSLTFTYPFYLHCDGANTQAIPNATISFHRTFLSSHQPWIVADSGLCGRNTRTAESQLFRQSRSRARNPFSPRASDPHSAASCLDVVIHAYSRS
ncbi:unnamed protein product [Cyclocybe aegerita]|uniref:Uncharacterized protein n=1 Tax=Cyclocybe aegerita TaxID=1973307 RepID=A0A8S0WCI9_CYCAE|nr:unnamed protein product [Cyclocybe aegerita]